MYAIICKNARATRLATVVPLRTIALKTIEMQEIKDSV